MPTLADSHSPDFWAGACRFRRHARSHIGPRGVAVRSENAQVFEFVASIFRR